jgi:hypothetical protein
VEGSLGQSLNGFLTSCSCEETLTVSTILSSNNAFDFCCFTSIIHESPVQLGRKLRFLPLRYLLFFRCVKSRNNVKKNPFIRSPFWHFNWVLWKAAMLPSETPCRLLKSVDGLKFYRGNSFWHFLAFCGHRIKFHRLEVESVCTTVRLVAVAK